MDFPSPSVLKQALLNHFNVPVLFKNAAKSWKLIPWSSEELSNQYGNISLQFRLVSKFTNSKSISWEGTTEYVDATINQFFEWQTTKYSSLQEANPFYKFKKDEFWAYSSYNYMNQIFQEDANILKVVNWSTFGYPEVSFEDSAFWIGSEGAYTPCHVDTYGFNLVAQIQGRKKWTLFPPEDTSFMYPTRIPYEESSIYSSVNILNPDIIVHPLFKFSHPHVLILEPGDVLFVPNKWWHFVQSLDITVSINSWIKLESDKDTRLEEGVTRALMSSFLSYFEPVGESWLNLGEELVLPETTLKYIISSLDEIRNSSPASNSQEDGSISHSKKINKMVLKSDVHSNASPKEDLKVINHKDIKYAVPEVFTKWYGKDCNLATHAHEIKLKNIVDCFVHPDVISVICKLLKGVSF